MRTAVLLVGGFGAIASAFAQVVPPAGLKGVAPAALDARVSPNVRLGGDPTLLPSNQNNQAEPHIFRSVANPDTVLATFQEGRFADDDGGSLDQGYAASTDGGFTWTRSLVPQLTTLTGGPYFRSTDPVAAIDLQGNWYLSSLDARNSAFTLDDLVVCRSTDQGATWTRRVAYSNPSPQLFADKDWLAVNDYAGSPRAGRLVVTWSGFSSTASGVQTGDALYSATSDDQGATWSSPFTFTAPGGAVQGTQPFFLPDGTLICVYQNYFSDFGFRVDCQRSRDGGSTWPDTGTVIANNQTEWDDPVLRTGGGLPAVAVARQTGAIFATWQAQQADGSARILVSHSTDLGATWSRAVIVSDNPATDSVFNPAVAATTDGAAVTVVFYDKRLAPDGQNYLDLFMAQSFDGGVTWAPNTRVTDFTTDARLTVLDSAGYMLGDYLALAPALSPTQGEIAIWCDTRYGNSDPFIARIAPRPTADFAAWQTVRFTAAELTDGTRSGALADPDGDGYPNFAEYALGTDPKVAESGASIAIASPGGATSLAWTERPPFDFTPRVEFSLDDGRTWASAGTISSAPQAGAATGQGAAQLTLPTGTVRLRLVFRQNSTGADAVVPDPLVVGGTGKLVNLSTSGAAGTGAAQLIAGFVVGGSAKTVLLRAVGPGLTAFGVSNVFTDPELTLRTTAGATVAMDDNWQDGGASALIVQTEAAVGAFPLASGSLDAAMVVPLASGGYTAAISGGAGATGSAALAEVYDADGSAAGSPAANRLLDVSTRGAVSSPGQPMIAGFVISGTEPKRVLIRAVGPGLTSFSVPEVLADPSITVYNAAGTVVATNDDWSLARDPSISVRTELRVGAFALPASSQDAALVLTLQPGAYTTIVTAQTGTSGNALVEVYDAD